MWHWMIKPACQQSNPCTGLSLVMQHRGFNVKWVSAIADAFRLFTLFGTCTEMDQPTKNPRAEPLEI